MLNSIQIKKTDPRIGNEFSAPKYATEGAGAMDMVACINEPLTIKPGEAVLVGTGIAIHINNPGYVAVLAPRSGNGHKRGMVLGNTIGVIDSDYQGEIKASILNRSSVDLVVEPGERIAQLMIMPVMRPELAWVDEFDTSTERGVGGFGSTGSK